MFGVYGMSTESNFHFHRSKYFVEIAGEISFAAFKCRSYRNLIVVCRFDSRDLCVDLSLSHTALATAPHALSNFPRK